MLRPQEIIANSRKNQFLRKMETDPLLREVKTVAEIVLDKLIQTKLTELETEMQQQLAEFAETISKLATKGDTPIAGIDFPMPKDGDDYILTDEDKTEIASKIEVPIVEKVIIEKTETIKEQPIITNQVTNEIKEVAKTDEPQIIADKLNTLEEKVDRKVIKGLEKELLTIKKNIRESKQQKGGGSGGGGYPVKSYDISDQLNGVLKTFTIPTNKYVIDVKITHPAPLRPTIDYIYTPTSITFTSQIDESTYLSAGQSVIIIYAEN